MQISIDSEYLNIIKEYCRPLKPHPTALGGFSKKLEGIHALIFDIYGTLFISDSGDIGTVSRSDNINIFNHVLAEAGVNSAFEAKKNPDSHPLHDAINEEHKRLKNKGIDYPEVDIIEIWKSVLNEFDNNLLRSEEQSDVFIKKLALSYELQVNPVWPMPGVLDVLSWFADKECLLGIVSNAQFYTPLIFKGLLGRNLFDLGFKEDLIVFSYRYARAKPSFTLFEILLERLMNTYSVSPQQVVYVGNDILNDIYPAFKLGMHTVLFAGDERSLRLREDNILSKDIRPDAVITNLRQLIEVIK
jgi:putative hydrolase of the HAD superfamily